MNKQRKQKEQLVTYLSLYNIDIETINTFLTFYKKNIKEKHTLYESPIYKLPCIETDTYDLPYDEENYTYYDDDDQTINNLPDLDFENEMRQDFETFKSICLEDNMLDLYNNIQLDDFYRLFAPNYNPVF